MTSLRMIPSRPVRGALRAPASKSVTNRLLVMAALADADPQLLTAPGLTGEWSARELIAHLGYWTGHATEALHHAEQGARRVVVGPHIGDLQARILGAEVVADAGDGSLGAHLLGTRDEDDGRGLGGAPGDREDRAARQARGRATRAGWPRHGCHLP